MLAAHPGLRKHRTRSVEGKEIHAGVSNGHFAARLMDAAAFAVAAAGLVASVTALSEHTPLLLRNLTALERRRMLDRAVLDGGPELPSATDTLFVRGGQAWKGSNGHTLNRNPCTLARLVGDSSLSHTHSRVRSLSLSADDLGVWRNVCFVFGAPGRCGLGLALWPLPVPGLDSRGPLAAAAQEARRRLRVADGSVVAEDSGAWARVWVSA